jgi:glutamyl-tRNA reductase
MSLLAIGLSHRSTPVDLLEKVVIDGEAIPKLLDDLLRAEHVSEALVLATCNRLEIHAEVQKFHGGVQDVGELLAAHTGVDLETLTEHLYVHYEDRAVQHLFAVAAGLDSMVVGEQQILGQLRAALNTARAEHAVGRALGTVADAALRVGTPRRTSTGPDARWSRSGSALPHRASATSPPRPPSSSAPAR